MQPIFDVSLKLFLEITFLRNIADESFIYQKKDTPAYSFQNPKDMFPYLLVTIGSGVSVLKVLLYVPIPPRNNRIRSISTKGIIIIIYNLYY